MKAAPAPPAFLDNRHVRSVSTLITTGQGKLEKVGILLVNKRSGKDIFLEKSGKIKKNGATRCQIFRLKCIKFDFRWGSAPDPSGGAYSAPQTA